MSLNFNPAELTGREAFDLEGRPRLVFGTGSVARVGELARAVKGRRALLVTDPGLVAAGHAVRVADHLRAAGLAVTVFDAVHENPTTDDVDACVAVARAAAADVFVGLGGGSAMDTAKGANFLLTNGGRIHDYWGVGRAKKPMVPLLAIPTTTGTGSELQSAALIADAVTHQKMACLDEKALARVAILDPHLTLSQPFNVAACTGLDAISHAVESAVTTKRNAESAQLSLAAFKLCFPAFPALLASPDADFAVHGRMQLGAALAGAAIECSMLGAAHAAANPLTAQFGVVHGLAVGLLLPAVVRFNAQFPEPRQRYAELAVAAGIVGPLESAASAAEGLARRLEDLLQLTGLPQTLTALNIPPTAIPALAAGATKQWTAGFNPRPITEPDFAALYAAVL